MLGTLLLFGVSIPLIYLRKHQNQRIFIQSLSRLDSGLISPCYGDSRSSF